MLRPTGSDVDEAEAQSTQKEAPLKRGVTLDDVVPPEPKEGMWIGDSEARARVEFDRKFPDFREKLFEAIDRLAKDRVSNENDNTNAG